MSYLEKLYEGQYVYTNNKQPYTEENFTIEKQVAIKGHLIFKSEVLSRLKTGEFLRLYVTYEVTSQFDPVQVEIKRTMGPKVSIELFKYDLKSKTLTYTFQCGEEKKQTEKIYTSLPHIATPAFATSMLMVNQKKLDPVHRTHYTLLASNNIWSFEGDLFENNVYLELQEVEPVKIKLNDTELNASHCKLLDVDANGTIASQGQSIYLSKHYFLPYKAEFENNLAIEIKRLKHFEDHMQKNFSQ